ncbi:hypothetical protein DUI87_02078 [Hirundo rustica rustica]|uniref:ribonuclease H n=1 Tax=Hirundo rustica rustica TaxID=333673 RepID=A0A3M0LE31_HIRRU|nr:hypothetical protein DUI87_02078 [Hirundo rustica rustica]
MHIPEYSQIVSPLYLVTRKKNDFHWGPEQQQAFAQIKQEIAHAVALGPVRTGPDVKNVLYSAAGNNGLSWSLWQKVAQATEGEGGSSQLAELKAVQLALDIAEREKWPKLYLYTDSWMVANALWGWLDRWKKANWQRRGKPIWAADEWKDIASRVEKLPVKVRHVAAHVPKSRANEEHQNDKQVDQAAKIEVSKIDLDWQHKGELFLARWAHDASGHQGRDATYKWARDRGVDLNMDSISQVIHDCETCAAIKQAKQVKPLWYGGRWSKYKYGEAWQIDYITLPQTRQGKRYVLTMVEATTGWLETCRGLTPTLRAEGQAGYEPLVQEQCQQTGMAALVQTLQLPTPQQPFATIIQGIDEPFLCFAGRLTAAVEKQEQLDQGHLEPSTSPWNTPVFCIKKKSGKWRLLQDLRKVNAVMEGMGTLQAACALSGVRKQFPGAHVYHYMDDILVAAPTQDELLRIQPQLLNALHSHGLQVAPEKVQQQPPWKYLGVKILERTIRHQEVQFVQSVKTLNDAQKLVGVITWLRPYLGLTTAQLSPLFELFKGDTDLKSPHELTPEARKVLEEVQQAVSARQVYRIEPSIDVTVLITTPDLHPTGIIGQWNDDWTDPLHILEWVFLPHQPHKTATALFELIAHLIIKCRQRCLQLMGADPSKIILRFRGRNLIGAMRTMFRCKVLSRVFQGRSLIICLATSYCKWPKILNFLYDSKIAKSQCKDPPSSLTVRARQEKPLLPGRMDLSGRFWKAMRMDSAYVADIAQRLGYSVLKEVSNPALFDLLKALWCAVQARVHPYYVLHVQSHTNLPGFVSEGNTRADKLANPAWVAPQPDVLTQAKASHGFFHQNAHTLQKQFQLTATEACEIVESCDDCHALGAPLPAGVNPRGLKALELWQTDATQVAELAGSSMCMSRWTQSPLRCGLLLTQERKPVMSLPTGGRPLLFLAYLLLWKPTMVLLMPRSRYWDTLATFKVVSVLTCDCRGRIQLTGKVEAVINLKVTKWMNP